MKTASPKEWFRFALPSLAGHRRALFAVLEHFYFENALTTGAYASGRAHEE